MHLDQASDQGQADPQAALGAGERLVGLGEQVKDAWQHLVAQADAGVLDSDQRIVSPTFGREGDRTARLGVLGRVIQEIGEDLLQPGRVAFHGKGVRREGRRESMMSGVH